MQIFDYKDRIDRTADDERRLKVIERLLSDEQLNPNIFLPAIEINLVDSTPEIFLHNVCHGVIIL